MVVCWHSERSGQAMSEAERLLRDILEHGDVVGRDSAGRTVLQLALTDAELDRLMAFGAEATEREDGGDDELYEALPVQVCWLQAA
jgi:hypothetical protein